MKQTHRHTGRDKQPSQAEDKNTRDSRGGKHTASGNWNVPSVQLDTRESSGPNSHHVMKKQKLTNPCSSELKYNKFII